jgi:hypothetical protein
MNNKFKQTAKTVLVVGAMLGFVGLASASTTFTPPGTGYAFPTNVDAPLNVGSAGQTKIGNLTTSGAFATTGLTNFGTLSQVGMATFLGGIKVSGGSAGQVLTWGTGSTASWATPAAGGGSVAPWHMSGSDASPTAILGSSAAQISGDAGGSIELGATNGNVGSGTPYIDFHGASVGSDYNMRIINSRNGALAIMGGDVGIGTTNPAARLEVTADSNRSSAVAVVSTNGGANGDNLDSTDVGGNGTAAMYGDFTVTGNATVGGSNVCRQDGTNCPGGTVMMYRVTYAPPGDGDGRDCGELGDTTTGPWISYIRNGGAGYGVGGGAAYSAFPNDMVTTHPYCRAFFDNGGYVWGLPNLGHLVP